MTAENGVVFVPLGSISLNTQLFLKQLGRHITSLLKTLGKEAFYSSLYPWCFNAISSKELLQLPTSRNQARVDTLIFVSGHFFLIRPLVMKYQGHNKKYNIDSVPIRLPAPLLPEKYVNGFAQIPQLDPSQNNGTRTPYTRPPRLNQCW